LRKKGLLTEEEYNQKVNKIETEKLEQNLKNSTEYKQLKSLLDSGILTNEEFNNKINTLKLTLNSFIGFNENDFKIKKIEELNINKVGSFYNFKLIWNNGISQEFNVTKTDELFFVFINEKKNKFFNSKHDCFNYLYNKK
jgi:hypothetical protein